MLSSAMSIKVRRATRLVLIAAAYFVTGKVGLHFATISPSAAAVWAPSGIAIGACLLWGNSVWPAISVAAFLVNITTAGSVLTSVEIACGNTGEALVGAFLINRFANGRAAFNQTQDAFKFLVPSAVVSTTVSASIGVTSLCYAGFDSWSTFPWIWFTWWLGDASGVLLIAPLMLLWAAERDLEGWPRRQVAEAIALVLGLGLTGAVVFGPWLSLGSDGYPLDVLCVPVLLWAAFRFGPREAATVNFLSSAIAVVGTLNGYGPFARGDQNQSLLLLQGFAGLTQVTVIAVAMEIRQRRLLDQEQRSARKAAEDQGRAKDEFLAMLGHELRNPLHTIGLAVRLIGDDSRNGERPLDVQRIIARQTRHLTRLVDDLLEVSRVISGTIVLQRGPLNLDAKVSECIETLRETEQLSGRRIELDLEEVWIDGDSDRITQIISNLLQNALKYTDHDAAIGVSVKAEAEQAVLKVRDSGIGIAPDFLPRIFDLFARGVSGTAGFPGGLGIGLTLVHRLVALHGGAITAASDGKNRGSTFIVRLPRISVPVASPDKPAAGAASAFARTVLIVEDEVEARASLRTLLELREHKVFEADDGPSGVDAALSIKPDLALIDIGLPGFDGYEVARRIRAAASGDGITLVAVTGYALPEYREKARHAGFDDLLPKPLDMASLESLLALHAPADRERAA